MSEQLHDQISAFVDGELPEHETELLLRRLERDDALRATLTRYVAVGAALRGEGARPLTNRLAVRVAAAVAAEAPAAGKSALRGRRTWLRPLAGLAVAATVASVAILGVQRLQQPAEETAGPVVASTQAPADIIGDPTAVETTESDRYTVPQPAVSRPMVNASVLTNYVVAHSEYSSVLGRRNVLSGVIAEDPTPVEEPDGGEAQAPAATQP
jgi:sigma-E factor negative regulatory protein RseA